MAPHRLRPLLVRREPIIAPMLLFVTGLWLLFNDHPVCGVICICYALA